MESGFLNGKQSKKISELATKVNSIDGKVIVNKDKPLKSILKNAGLSGKTGSFALPRDVGSVSMVPNVAPVVTDPIPTECTSVSLSGLDSFVPKVANVIEPDGVSLGDVNVGNPKVNGSRSNSGGISGGATVVIPFSRC